MSKNFGQESVKNRNKMERVSLEGKNSIKVDLKEIA
jgi:hypothetical protein